MKKLLLLVVVATLVFSCSDSQETMNNDEFLEIEIPTQFSSKSQADYAKGSSNDLDVQVMTIQVTDKEGNVSTGKIRFTMPESHGDYLHKLEMTSNIFEETDLKPDFFINKINLARSNVLQKGSCIADCHKQFTDKDGNKIKGRGWCKAGCWVDTLVKVATVVVAVVKLT